MHWNLLQLPQFYKEPNPMDAVYFVIGVGLVIAVLVIVNLSKKRLGITNSALSAPRPMSGRSTGVRKFSRSLGLDSSQSKMLAFVLKNGGAANLQRIIQSPALLDRYFKHAYDTIEQDAGAEEETQQKLSVLFATRNILESAAGGGLGIDSTWVIPENTTAVLAADEDSYPVRVISSRGPYFLVENPVNAQGDPVSIDKNTAVTLSFFTQSSNGFVVDTTVYGTAKTPGEGRVLQVVHSSAIKRLSQRRFRRRQTLIPVEFNQVRLEPGPRKREQKMVVDKRKAAGKILDISIGGCSIQTSGAISAGIRLKIGFTVVSRQVVALGEVLRINRNRTGTVMHIKFLKIPRKSLNIINAFVFEYMNA
jgi:hypothetical protein